MNRKRINRNVSGFTIVELLVVLSIIGMLAGLLLPSVNTSRPAGRQKMCTITMANISQALFQYHERYRTFPPAYVTDSEGEPLYSWRVLILPFLGYEDLYRRFHLDEPWDSEANKTLLDSGPRDFCCPSAFAEPGQATCMMIVGPGTLSSGPDCVSLKDITNDKSKTILFIETVHGVPWSAPIDIPLFHLEKGIRAEELCVSSNHPRIVHIAFADRSVRPVAKDVEPKTLQKAASISGDDSSE